jgi:hypothetical protein
MFADRIGVRESGRVVGHATLAREDLLRPIDRSDAVAQAAFPIDIHDSNRPGLSHAEQLGECYDIPYGCLVADGLDNLLLAGRCISSTHEANGSVRITATCFATGEAAGVAAALAARGTLSAASLNVRAIQEVLLRRGGLLRSAVQTPNPSSSPT